MGKGSQKVQTLSYETSPEGSLYTLVTAVNNTVLLI